MTQTDVDDEFQPPDSTAEIATDTEKENDESLTERDTELRRKLYGGLIVLTGLSLIDLGAEQLAHSYDVKHQHFGHLVTDAILFISIAYGFVSLLSIFAIRLPNKKIVKLRVERGAQLLAGIYGILLLVTVTALKVFACADAELYNEFGIALLVAALVSYIFDITYHETNFLKPVKDIKTIVNKATMTIKDEEVVLEKLTGVVKDADNSFTKQQELLGNLTKIVEDAQRVNGLIEYRSEIQREYKKVSRRIVSVADYWLIDEEWWSDVVGSTDYIDSKTVTEYCRSCPLYTSLRGCYELAFAF